MLHVPSLTAMEAPVSQSESPRSKNFWKSVEQWENTPEFQRLARDEFAPGVVGPTDTVSRRTFLSALAASMAAAGLAGCKPKISETIVPYVRQPAEITPGRPLYFATTMTIGGYAEGVIATSREGRPIKLDGNPDHPANLGGSDVFLQAAILDMYDPDRSQTVQRGGIISDWDTFVGLLRNRLPAKTADGSGLAILTETITSPTLIKQISDLKSKYPGSKWYVHDPLSRQNIRDGLRRATAREVMPHYDFTKANVIVSFDCDFLFDEPGHSRHSRDFMDGRRIREGTNRMNRLYMIESTASITGTMADHRWAMKPSKIPRAALELAEAVKNISVATGWAKTVAADLLDNRGKSLALAGSNQSPETHAVVHSINEALGNINSAVRYASPVEGDGDGSLQELTRQMQGGRIDTLFILGGNPCYSAPADVPFDSALEQFSKQSERNVSVRLGNYEDETSLKCQWHLPQTHFLEEWSDARSYDGTVSMGQPLIAPLYAGRSVIQVLDLMLFGYLRDGYEIAREFWAAQHATTEPTTRQSSSEFEVVWRRSLENGVWQGTYQPILPRDMPSSANLPTTTPSQETFEVVFRADPCVWDGKYANNGFLQELPKPLTKLTWDNAACVSPNTARTLEVNNGDLIEIASEGRSLETPAWILPGLPDDTVTLHLGYGRSRAGKVGTGIGFNAYKLRTVAQPWFCTSVQIRKIGGTYPLVATHTHQTISSRREADLDARVVQRPGDDSLDNRKLIRVGTLQQFVEDPGFVKRLDDEENRHHLTLYPGYGDIYKNNLAWGMSIDLQSCIGCNACIVACQAENNIPVVGKEQVAIGREMHWIRIDTYYEGDPGAVSAVYHQPVPCQHCENAPCELVCPVGATVHDNEGINDMVYNRCVGTRYCSNNCPYKVRRFNFLQYDDQSTESLKLMRNPEVTVRSRGVMEKCTYCIQRIVATRIDLEIEQVQSDDKARAASPDEAATIQRRSAQIRQQKLDALETACQQACPTQAIVFGNLNPLVDPIHEISPEHLSNVARLKREPLNYSLLAELTTQPRTTYLARIQNPNPALSSEVSPS